MSGENFPGNNVNTEGGASAKNSKQDLRRALAVGFTALSMLRAGCKDKGNGKDSKNTKDSSNPTASDFVPGKESSESSDGTIISTEDVTVSTPVETEKAHGKAKVNEAEAEYNAEFGIYEYSIDSIDIEPGLDYQDYLMLPENVKADSAPEQIDFVAYCKDLGITSDIRFDNEYDLCIGNPEEDNLAITISGYDTISYYINGKVTYRYSGQGGKGMSKDGVSLYYLEDDGYHSKTKLHSEDMPALEVMLRAYAEGRTDSPFELGNI